MMQRKIINLLSGPRNVSTALMYAFAQHPDIKVVDEPLYGHYLKNTKVQHPHQNEYQHLLVANVNEAINQYVFKDYGKPITFIKNMAHHHINMDIDYLRYVDSLFLIRDPMQMLLSLINQVEYPKLLDTALEQQVFLYEKILEYGKSAIILDSKTLLENPRKALNKICDELNISFSNDMLSWDIGGIPEDGPWAPFWYHNVHKSSGFMPYVQKSTKDFPKYLQPLLKEADQYYKLLSEKSIKV